MNNSSHENVVMKRLVTNGCGHEKLVMNGCSHEKVGYEYYSKRSQQKLMGNSWLHEMDGGNILWVNSCRAMASILACK